MRFALLGDDVDVLPLARAVIADSRHTLVGTALATRCHAELVRVDPRLRACRTWEELLSDTELDAVLVCGDDDEGLRAARQLAVAGKALLVFPTPGQTSTFAYELALLEGELPVVLAPAFALREHPLVQKLHALIAGGMLGRVRHLQWTHQWPSGEGDRKTLISPTELATELLGNVDLLRHLGGDYDQVSATRSGDAVSGYSLATVTLGGANLPQAVWSATVGCDDCDAWKLTVAGESGTCALAWDERRGELALEHGGSRETASVGDIEITVARRLRLRDFALHESSGAILDKFVARREDKTVRPDWTDMTRAFEILDAVERSIRRRRTIDLHFEAPSERSVFKTQMTALGCGLLSATLGAVVVFLIVATAFDLNETVKRVLRFLIFLPLGLFLVLQLLLFVAKPPRGGEKQ